MTEFNNPVDIAEEIKHLKVDLANAGSFAERERISGDILKLTTQKVGIRRRADKMRERMREAADKAEDSGVGTGGRGTPTERDD